MSETGNLAKSVSRVLAVTLVVTTLAVSPWMTIDPINLIKLMTLSSGAFAIGILILVYFPRDLFVSDRTVLSISIIFILQLILVFFLSSFDKSLQFFGIMGRNTGLLFHLALVLVLLGSVIISRPEEYQKYITLITLVGLISAIYGLIQFLDLDPINWANKYSPIIGFLGNPNFQSSILGLSAIGALVILVDSSLTVIKRVFGLLCIFFSLLIAFLSDSQQGILVFALGFVCIGFFKVRSLRKRVLVNFYVVGATSIFLLSIIGFFNKGPLSNILYQPSVTYRG